MALLPGKEEDGWRDRGWRPPPGSTSNVRFSDLLFSFTLGSIRQFIQSYRAELPSDLVWRISSNCPTLTYLWCWWSSEQSEEEYYFYDQLVTICRFPPGQRRPLQSTFDRGGRHGRHALWGGSCLDDGDWSDFSVRWKCVKDAAINLKSVKLIQLVILTLKTFQCRLFITKKTLIIGSFLFYKPQENFPVGTETFNKALLNFYLWISLQWL